MGRPRKNPDYDPQRIMDGMLDAVVEAYKKSLLTFDRKGEIKMIADELEIAPHKARKLLITAGLRDDKDYYINATGNTVLSLYQQGKSVNEIMMIMGLNRTSVCCYLPYSKGIYNAKELSLDAERIRRYRDRQRRCDEFIDHIKWLSDKGTEEYLWDTLDYLAGCVFWTLGDSSKNKMRYKYEIRGREMFISKQGKTIRRSAIMSAFATAKKIQSQHGYVISSNALGISDGEYLYPVFLRLGICMATDSKETAGM